MIQLCGKANRKVQISKSKHSLDTIVINIDQHEYQGFLASHTLLQNKACVFLLFSRLGHKATFTLSHVLIAKSGFEEEEEKSPVSAWQVLESQGQMKSVCRSPGAGGALEHYVWMAVGDIMCSLFKDVHLSSFWI